MCSCLDIALVALLLRPSSRKYVGIGAMPTLAQKGQPEVQAKELMRMDSRLFGRKTKGLRSRSGFWRPASRKQNPTSPKKRAAGSTTHVPVAQA